MNIFKIKYFNFFLLLAMLHIICCGESRSRRIESYFCIHNLAPIHKFSLNKEKLLSFEFQYALLKNMVHGKSSMPDFDTIAKVAWITGKLQIAVAFNKSDFSEKNMKEYQAMELILKNLIGSYHTLMNGIGTYTKKNQISLTSQKQCWDDLISVRKIFQKLKDNIIFNEISDNMTKTSKRSIKIRLSEAVENILSVFDSTINAYEDVNQFQENIKLKNLLSTIELNVNKWRDSANSGLWDWNNIKIHSITGDQKSSEFYEDLYINTNVLHFLNVIYTLLDNANKFHENMIKLDLEVDLDSRQPSFIISVENDGGSIAAEALQPDPSFENRMKLFSPQYTKKGDGTFAKEGTGTGTAISWHFARVLGYEISVDHSRQSGAKISLKIPFVYSSNNNLKLPNSNGKYVEISS